MAFSFASGHLPRGPHSVFAGWPLLPRVDCPFFRREPSTLRGLSPLLFVGNGPPALFVGNGPLTLFVGNGPPLFVGNGPPTLFVGNGPLLSRATAPYSRGLGPPLLRVVSPLSAGRPLRPFWWAEPPPVPRGPSPSPSWGGHPPCARLSSASLATAGSPQDRAKSRLVCALADESPLPVASGAVWR